MSKHQKNMFIASREKTLFGANNIASRRTQSPWIQNPHYCGEGIQYTHSPKVSIIYLLDD